MLESCEDRTVPTPVVTIAPFQDAHEGGASAIWRLTRSNTSDLFVSGSATLGGTATGGTDYSSLGSTVSWSFSGGSSTTDVTIPVTDDGTSEATETITLTLNSGLSYTVGSPSAATVNLLDNDAQYVSVANVANAAEGGSSGTLRFTRIGNLSSSLTANFSVGGTATSGTDFTAIGTTVTFAANSATADKTVAALADNSVESTETVVATVTSGTGYTVGSPSAATVNITDDPPVISVTASDTFEGAATGGFSFTRSGGNLSSSLAVTYSVSGTATVTTDYTALSGSGSVTFAADEDRVEVAVEALGDNTSDDGETVIATLTGAGSTYTIDGTDGAATVTIADQPLTISVVALTDGEEGVSNGSFRFTRSGDISSSLIVTYTVSGTATSGTDFTALSGSVTFAASSDHTDVTVTVTNDGGAEQTETVTVTLDTSDDYSLGNDSDTIFIRDNDTRELVWTGGASDGFWQSSGNWVIAGTSTHVAPTQYDDLYFDGSVSNANCTNVGYGLSGTPLYGLHIIGGYSGTLTLANALSVGTYEQTAGTLNQPSARNLTITSAMLWSGGTLDTTDSGAEVNIDGAVGRIDPPNSGSMSIASTFRVLNYAVVTMLPGTLDFKGGQGMYINADVKAKAETTINVVIRDRRVATNSDPFQLEIATNGALTLDTTDAGGRYTSELPIKSAGHITIYSGIHVEVFGHVDGGTGPSIKQTGGTFWWWTGSNVMTDSGMTVTGGELKFWLVKGNTKAEFGGNFKLEGGSLEFTKFSQGLFRVIGNVEWTGGTYLPRVEGASAFETDAWGATKTFTVGATVTLTPIIYDPTEAEAGSKWAVLFGESGITGNPPSLPMDLQANWDVFPETLQLLKWWNIRRKPA